MPETEAERAARKAREAELRAKETPEERAIRKAKEAEREKRRTDETPEERAARKAKEAEVLRKSYVPRIPGQNQKHLPVSVRERTHVCCLQDACGPIEDAKNQNAPLMMISCQEKITKTTSYIFCISKEPCEESCVW